MHGDRGQATTYLRPTAPIAADALLTGDPATAMALARHLVEAPLMANHSYGLWGYSGTTGDGLELTIQATGIGGPSAALVLDELARSGARRVIRVGHARALDPTLGAGDAIVVESAIAGDGASRALGKARRLFPDAALGAALARACGPAARQATVLSIDLDLGDDAPGQPAAAALDLETAAFLAAARRAGIGAAAALLIAEGMGEDRLRERTLELGAASARALATG